jgi:hypothetical protein
VQCPRCSQFSPDAWQTAQIVNKTLRGATQGNHIHNDEPGRARREPDGDIRYQLDWMFCANPDCGKALIRVERTYRVFKEGEPDSFASEHWLAVTRRLTRPIDPIVVTNEPELAKDFGEAAAVLAESPRLAALLARRIEADLLLEYGKYKGDLFVQVDAFIADPGNPSGLKAVIDAPRQVGNWTAHKKTSVTNDIVEASPEEAELSLQVVDRLFDFYIVQPAKDAAIMAGIQAKQASIARGTGTPPRRP